MFTKCFWSGHKYKARHVHHYWDTSYGGKASATCVTYVCLVCNKVKTKVINGAGFIPLHNFSEIKDE